MSEYYTYLDVLERLRSIDAYQAVPNEVLRAQPLPSRLMLYLRSRANVEPVKIWLSSVFGPRFIEDKLCIALESIDMDNLRILPIDIERSDEEDILDSQVRLRPTLLSGNIVTYNVKYDLGNVDSLEGFPPVLTFHSFKGGMGRTTLAVSLAMSLVDKGSKVLFVDADFEAPGISSLLKHVMPNPRISFADLLAIAHTSIDVEGMDAINIVANRLQDQDFGGLVVLPCTRDTDIPAISPDNLTVSIKRSPFFVGSLIARLGAEVNADIVIVDLRAGLSETIASLFLDPRLQHTLVTTLNGQAIDGTITLLKKMREMASKWQSASGVKLDINLPNVIINQVPAIYPEVNEHAAQAMDIFDEEVKLFLDQTKNDNQDTSDNPFQDANLVTSIINFEKSVTILPRDLRQVSKLLAKTDLPQKMHSIFGSIVPQKSDVTENTVGIADPDTRRQRLAKYAQKSVFAESQPQADIYPTGSLTNLAERHQNTVPNVTVIGEKGSGKSYTFMSIALAKNWGNFSKRLGISSALENPTASALILPVTPSQDLDKDARDAERLVTSATAMALSGNAPLNDQLIADAVQNQMRSDNANNTVEWREFWLDLIAWRAGFAPLQRGAFKLLNDSAANGRSVISIFDGIETLFSRLRTSESEKAAVEALLRLVPDWLSQLPARNLGCVIFIREDLARYALTNNFKQFEDRYSAYALRWNWAEASALALWIAQQADSLARNISPDDLVELDEEVRSQALADLWGWKMGPETSREARSLEWTMSSLSDFNRRIKARDLVRFLAESASRSGPQDAYYDNRLLSPRAMRDAVGPCSEERVFETGEESVDLKRIFLKVQGLTGNQRELPWSYDKAHEIIGTDDVRILEDNGVLFRYDDEFFVPELYRSGLNLFYSGGARRKVVTLMRQAAVKAR